MINFRYRIYGDNLGGGTCRGCGRAVVWADTLQGRKLPIDGTVLDLAPVATEHDLSLFGVRPVWIMSSTVNPAHFQTCPARNRFRR